MVINTKSRCPMCQEQVESAYFRDKAGNRTTLCARCQNLIAAFVPGRDGNKAKEILAKYGMSAEKIEDLVSPAAAADEVVMKAIGMDVFNNRIKPANVIPGSKLAQEVIKAQFVPPQTAADFKFGFKGMIGFDGFDSDADRAKADLEQRYQDTVRDRKLQDIFLYDAKAGSVMGVLKNISVPAEGVPERTPEPPAKIDRVARAIAGEDEE